MGLHWPTAPGRLQDLQAVEQVELQQTPSTQLPAAHSALDVHALATAFLQPPAPSQASLPLLLQALVGTSST